MDIGRRIRAPLVQLCRRWRLSFEEERLQAECRRVLAEVEKNRALREGREPRVPEQLPRRLHGVDLWAWMLDRAFADRDGPWTVELCIEVIPDEIKERNGVRTFARAIMQALFETCDVGCGEEELQDEGRDRVVQCGCTRRDEIRMVSTFWVESTGWDVTIRRGAQDFDMRIRRGAQVFDMRM